MYCKHKLVQVRDTFTCHENNAQSRQRQRIQCTLSLLSSSLFHPPSFLTVFSLYPNFYSLCLSLLSYLYVVEVTYSYLWWFMVFFYSPISIASKTNAFISSFVHCLLLWLVIIKIMHSVGQRATAKMKNTKWKNKDIWFIQHLCTLLIQYYVTILCYWKI